MTEDKNQAEKIGMQLAAARAVLAATGKSPRQIGVESRLAVIQWIYHWGNSSATSIQELLNRTAAGYAQKLARQGWLQAVNTESGTPKCYFTLSEPGLQEAERHAVVLLRYPEIDPYRVNQKLIRHNLIAQHATINALNAGLAVDYLTERMLSQTVNKVGEKIPDVVWITVSGLHIGVEVELSAKWERDLDQFVMGVIRALMAQNDKPAKYDRFVIITDSPAIKKRYSDAFQPNANLSVWKKDDRQHWVIDKTAKVPDWVIGKIDFHLMQS